MSRIVRINYLKQSGDNAHRPTRQPDERCARSAFSASSAHSTSSTFSLHPLTSQKTHHPSHRPISSRNPTDLEPELDRSRRGVRPISTSRGGRRASPASERPCRPRPCLPPACPGPACLPPAPALLGSAGQEPIRLVVGGTARPLVDAVGEDAAEGRGVAGRDVVVDGLEEAVLHRR